MSFFKKGLKSAGKFIKKNWKKIVLVAVAVFAMGLSTVGSDGFSGAMEAGGGGFGGFMSAVGSTMWAGVTALGGTLNLGPGAQGTAAEYGNVTGAGLFGGHAAAALGSDSAKAGIAAQEAAKSGVTLSPAVGLPSAVTAPSSMSDATGPAAPLMGTPTPNPPAPITGASTVPTVARQGSGLAQAAAITVGGNMLAGWAAGKAAEEEDPKGFWGVDLTGKGEDVPPTITERPAPPALNYPSMSAMQMMVQAPLPPGLMNAPPPGQQQPGVYG